MNIKGSLPLLILHHLNPGPKHGYQIAREIREKSEGILDFTEGTLYPTLHRLENEGWVTSFRQRENGRMRRYYRLTDRGHKGLASERKEWRQFADAVNHILGEANEPINYTT
jgi:transcriptional regulator